MPAPTTGQVNLSGTAQQLGNVGTASAFVIKAPLSNSSSAWIGGSAVTSSTGFQLDPGDEFSYERVHQAGSPPYEMTIADLYVVGSSGDRITWLASR